jgi:hypothetical protein
MPMTRRWPVNSRSAAMLLLAPALVLVGCAPEPGVAARAGTAAGPSAEQVAFWTNLEALCGQAFAGEMLEGPETSDWWEAELVMHVRECTTDEIRIPLHVDDDRSRTWVVTRTDAGLQLKHDHRLPDGTPDADNTDYGGDTAAPGSETRQEFPADEHSVAAVPARATQHWFLEVHPGEIFAYGLFREETGLSYRIEFDLTEPVEAPPAPWGWEG